MTKRLFWATILALAATMGCSNSALDTADWEPGTSTTSGTTPSTAQSSGAATTPTSGAPSTVALPASARCNAGAVSWQTPTVSLRADAFWIVANGLCFTATGVAVATHSDPGGSRYTTLELTWTELSREMRFFLYFKADADHWWSEEMRTYDGQQPNSDWLFYYGDFFRTPVGQTFHGDLDLSNDSKDELRGELHLRGLTLTTTLSGR